MISNEIFQDIKFLIKKLYGNFWDENETFILRSNIIRKEINPAVSTIFFPELHIRKDYA